MISPKKKVFKNDSATLYVKLSEAEYRSLYRKYKGSGMRSAKRFIKKRLLDNDFKELDALTKVRLRVFLIQLLDTGKFDATTAKQLKDALME